MLQGKNIILGITGSIAAYKAAIIVRLLKKNGANVKVLMTPLSKEFITPITIATLAKEQILVDFYNPENGDWNSHVNLSLWADVFLIAPATANTIAKMAGGIADNLLLTTFLSARCSVFVAPAMDVDMYNNPATQDNIKLLKKRNVFFIEPEDGELASGLSGKGRLAEPEIIVSELNNFFAKKQSLQNKKILITAGPTYEKIDSVRFIGNYSSGKMGYSIAKICADRGADVTLISGPVNISLEYDNVKIINVESAKEMYDFCVKLFPENDIAIMSAAVADFSVDNQQKEKIKRGNENLSLTLIPNKDIAAKLGEIKRNNQILLGFALESNDELNNAISKLEKKNLDFIVLNSLKDNNSCFNTDTNKITIINKKHETTAFPLKDKKEVASDIIDYLEDNYL